MLWLSILSFHIFSLCIWFITCSPYGDKSRILSVSTPIKTQGLLSCVKLHRIILPLRKGKLKPYNNPHIIAAKTFLLCFMASAGMLKAVCVLLLSCLPYLWFCLLKTLNVHSPNSLVIMGKLKYMLELNRLKPYGIPTHISLLQSQWNQMLKDFIFNRPRDLLKFNN